MDKEPLLPNVENPPAYEPTAPVHHTQPLQPTAPQGYVAGYTQPQMTQQFPQPQMTQQLPQPQMTQQLPQQPYYQYQAYQTQLPYNQPQEPVITGCLWCVAFTSLFCCTLFGILALIFAFSGYDNEKRFEYERARHNAKLVKVFGGLAITIGLCVLALSSVCVIIEIIVFSI